MSKPTSVEDYIDTFSPPARDVMLTLRGLARETALGTTEQLKWGNPAYLHRQGTILFVFSGHKAHANFVFTPSTREAFDRELAGFNTGKGSVQLPYSEPAPTQLLTRMVEYRIREFEIAGVKWM